MHKQIDQRVATPKTVLAQRSKLTPARRSSDDCICGTGSVTARVSYTYRCRGPRKRPWHALMHPLTSEPETLLHLRGGMCPHDQRFHYQLSSATHSHQPNEKIAPTVAVPTGGLPDFVTTAQQMLPAYPPMYAGAMGDTDNEGKEVRHERV